MGGGAAWAKALEIRASNNEPSFVPLNVSDPLPALWV
jgi:hypothetical protein